MKSYERRLHDIMDTVQLKAWIFWKTVDSIAYAKQVNIMKPLKAMAGLAIVATVTLLFLSAAATSKEPVIVYEDLGQYLVEVYEEPEEIVALDPIDMYRGRFTRAEIEIIIAVESEGNTLANSCAGAHNGRGLMQISEVALQDYNEKSNTQYIVQDLYDPSINIMIGCWYLNYYGSMVDHPTNMDHVYAVYNLGLGNYRDYYYSHYGQGIRPDGVAYTAIKRLHRMQSEHEQGNWRFVFAAVPVVATVTNLS